MSKKSVRFVLAAALIGCLFLASPVLYGQKLDETTLKSLTYREIGPTRQSGRFVDFAWNPKEPKTFYAATASGHLWKSLDNGRGSSTLGPEDRLGGNGRGQQQPQLLLGKRNVQIHGRGRDLGPYGTR
jgi:hypothetical protein